MDAVEDAVEEVCTQLQTIGFNLEFETFIEWLLIHGTGKQYMCLLHKRHFFCSQTMWKSCTQGRRSEGRARGSKGNARAF